VKPTALQSHGGSSAPAQARAVAEGLQADVVTFNQVTDIEFLRSILLDDATRHGLITAL
jgi:ABC-type sulfate transport system substrate-binding protein